MLHIYEALTLTMALYTYATQDDPLIFIANPVEAEMPGHWMPLSIVKVMLNKSTKSKLVFTVTKTSWKRITTSKTRPPETIKTTTTSPIPEISPETIPTTTQPQEITEPPETPTESPETATEPPETTIESPETTTQPPETTTQPPETTTQPPETTAEPEVETEPPKVETEPPKVETEPPEVETEPPETTTEPPTTIQTTRKGPHRPAKPQDDHENMT